MIAPLSKFMDWSVLQTTEVIGCQASEMHAGDAANVSLGRLQVCFREKFHIMAE